MANGKGKKKGKKGKTLVNGNGSDGSMDGTPSPAALLASLQGASKEELEEYLHQLYSICEGVNEDGLAYSVAGDSEVPVTGKVGERGYVDYSDGKGADALDEYFDAQGYYIPSASDLAKQNQVQERMQLRSSDPPPIPPRAPPTLPPRYNFIPPPLAPREPLDLPPLYNYEVYRNVSYVNSSPPRPPPRESRVSRTRSRSPTRRRSRSPTRRRSRSPTRRRSRSPAGRQDANTRGIDSHRGRSRDRRSPDSRDHREVALRERERNTRPSRDYPQLRDGQADDPMAFDMEKLSGVIKDMLGIGQDIPSGDFMNHYLILGSNLDPKIKSKIIAGEFVEMNVLWDQDELPARVDMSFKEDDYSQMSFSAAKARDPATLTEWSYLFFTYASVYASYHPAEAGGVFTYMRRIADMHRDNPNTYIWRIYDTKFRKAKAACKLLPWHVNITQMQSDARSAYYRSLSFKTKKPQNVGRGGQPTGQNPGPRRRVRNSCDRYNTAAGCSNTRCRFSHVCNNCGKANHTVLQCHAFVAPPVPSPGPSGATAATTPKSK